MTPLSAVDELLLSEWMASARSQRAVVIGSAPLAEAVSSRVREDVYLFEDTVNEHDAAPAGVVRRTLSEEFFNGATVVLLVLPKNLAELDEIAGLAARSGTDLVAAGRIKHMTRGMNEVLARHYDQVSASLGVRKARALRATSPRADAPAQRYPLVVPHPALGFSVAAHGGAFAGTKIDIGTRALIDAWDDYLAAVPRGGHVVDIGCGTGILATAAALARPDVTVSATDRSWAAVSSTTRTAALAGVADRVIVTQENAGASIAAATADLVVMNPPFHDGTTVVDDLATPLFRAAHRILRTGGLLLTVYNSHLPHRAALAKLVGHTTQLSRTSKFTVTASRAR